MTNKNSKKIDVILNYLGIRLIPHGTSTEVVNAPWGCKYADLERSTKALNKKVDAILDYLGVVFEDERNNTQPARLNPKNGSFRRSTLSAQTETNDPAEALMILGALEKLLATVGEDGADESIDDFAGVIKKTKRGRPKTKK